MRKSDVQGEGEDHNRCHECEETLQARVRELEGVVEECGEVLDNVRCYLGLCGPGDGGDRRADAPDHWGISHALD